MTCGRWQCGLVYAAVVATWAGGAYGQEYLLSGNRDGLWLLRRTGATFDVVARPTDAKWQWIDRDQRGTPTAAAAVGDRLHLLVSTPQGPGYLMFGPGGVPLPPGPKPGGDGWSGYVPPAAACESEQFGHTRNRTMLVLVPAGARAREAPPATTTTAATRPGAPAPSAATRPTQPARPTRPASRRADGRSLAVFQNAGAEWVFVTELPDVALKPDSRVLAAVCEKVLYVLIATPGEANRLAAFDDAQRAWRPIALSESLAGSAPLAVMNLAGRVTVVLAAPAQKPDERTLLIATYEPDKQSFLRLPITRDGEAATWAADHLPMAAQLSGQIALLWRRDDALRLARCGLTGEILADEEVDIFRRGPLTDAGRAVLEYFCWGVLVAILGGMIFLRSHPTDRPFTLPHGVIPAGLLPRAVATLIDFAPFALAGWGLIILPETPTAELTTALRQQKITEPVAYGVVLTLLTHTAYGIAMELRFGATVGKMLLRLRVVGDEGKRAGPREIALRNLTKIFELLLMSIPWLLPLIVLVPLLNRGRQRLGDMFGRTAVINSRASLIPPQPPDEVGPPGPSDSGPGGDGDDADP